ncbi:type IV conjugative transfer system coupling protein TraD [Cysteiniphilum sp. JM-1]|uniref:type IV conjugative transfer system coupling protein TraD n=1 Tax=Cysteiniphilum sp. JM-1 TaxID=2610891 RepID=UPI001248BC58|nr:type IV conjugative transfer system coupling protein TraD [Cysteiniphilum sp. JM-1]
MTPQKTKSFIRGTQIFFYNLAMFVQSMRRIGIWAVLIYIGIFIVLMFLLTSMADVKTLSVQIWANFLNSITLGNKIVASDAARGISLTAAQIANNPIDQSYFTEALQRFTTHAIISALIGGVIYLIAMAFFIRAFVKKGDKNSLDQFISGTTLARSEKQTIRSVNKSKEGAGDITIANALPLPRLSERQGIFIHGSIGTGKTQVIMYLLDEIKRTGDVAIVYDKECTLKPYFFNEATDKELNPLSVLCENWDIWKECKTPIEMGSLATYLMPKAVQGSDPFWVDAARTIFATVAWKMRDQPDKNVIKLLQVLLTTSLDELRGILKGTEAENLVSKDIEKTAISIRAVMATYTKSLRFLEGLDKDKLKKPFAIRDWIQAQVMSNANQKGWLFVTSRANFHAEIKPLISAWLGMALKSIQSLQPNPTRRVWVIMDEKASLNRLEGFSDIVADIRKFGGCVVLGLQSHSQVNFIYGRDEANAITDNMNTSVYFRSPKKQVAEWVSQDLGEHVLEEIRESQSYGPNTIRDGNTIARQRVTRRTVDTGTIMNLENLNCYVRLAGNHPITRLAIDYKERKQLLEQPLIERAIDYDAIEKVTLEALKAENNPERDEAVKVEQKVNQVNDKVGSNANFVEVVEAEDNQAHKVEEQESTYVFHQL